MLRYGNGHIHWEKGDDRASERSETKVKRTKGSQREVKVAKKVRMMSWWQRFCRRRGWSEMTSEMTNVGWNAEAISNLRRNEGDLRCRKLAWQSRQWFIEQKVDWKRRINENKWKRTASNTITHTVNVYRLCCLSRGLLSPGALTGYSLLCYIL
jgi:hypothetical protein